MTPALTEIAATRTLWARSRFVRHLVEMFLAMWIGMALSHVLFAAVYGSGDGEALRRHDPVWAIVMAFGMTVPMVAWMLYRGHSRRGAGEMAVVMIAPVLPLVALKLSHVISGPVAGSYMCVSTFAMVALMVHRRGQYRMVAAHG